MLRSMMDPEQARRFDAFSSVVIPKGPITKLNKDLFDQKLQGNLSAVLAGMAKILITEVVELAKELQPHSAMPSGRLRPYHLRLAREELERRGVLSGTRRNGGTGTALRPYKPLFRR
ncbi:putative transcription initiation factor tfIID [Kockovaella imperatae]|uniref:Putative transcription initiation factor tfIID n=1 Tax=Kockovaella imperatae TaxID=4999 RepID=A0A1Y1U9M6_9TREE|nr:putative transcription initiation factor tfIID [Kockovaella imperatae]ORX34244.1 putative transcription initiation factor tfIID [Kockovaella imperatae]